MLIAAADASNGNTRCASMPGLGEAATRAAECDRTGCSTGQCPILHKLGQAKTFAKGEVIFREDEANDCVYLVLSGVVRGCKVMADGRRLIARFGFPGELLEYDQRPQCPFTAEAITPVRAIAIRRCRLDRALSEESCLQSLMTRSLIAELEEARSQVLALGRLSATERVAQFLYSITQATRKDCDGAVQIPMCRADIADYLGLTIETVSRVFSRLKRDGMIKLLDNNRFVILDEDDFVAGFLADAN